MAAQGKELTAAQKKKLKRKQREKEKKAGGGKHTSPMQEKYYDDVKDILVSTLRALLASMLALWHRAHS
eukprot:1151494-Pelagomonas_calceolata.AAC.4